MATNRWKWLAGTNVAQGAAGWLAFVLPFVGLLIWFRVVDVYHQHFFDAEPNKIYLIYNAFRTLYSLYLIWLLYWVGSILLRTLERKGIHLDLGILGEVVLCFYAGAAIANAVGFLLGYMQLYYFWILAPATLLLLGLSYPAFVVFVAGVQARWADAWAHEKDAAKAGAKLFTLGAVIFIAVLLLVVQALPPGMPGDYYQHYLPYFKQVVKSHGLWPNDLWYHYYISKGAALVFWSIVLTDLQAPEMVTYAFMLVSGLAVCSIVWRWCGNSVFAMAAMGAYLAAFVWPLYEGDPDAWGQFQKHHERTASLIASVAWLILVIPGYTGSVPRTWSLFASLLAANTVLFTPTAYPLVVALFALGILGSAIRKQWQMMKCFGVAVAAATAMLTFLLALNYWTTGLAEITPMRFFWKYANQERFSQVWSPYLMVLLEEGSNPEMGNLKPTLPSDTSYWQFTTTLLRLQHLYNFFPTMILIPCIWLVVGLFLIRGRYPRFDLVRALLLILGFLTASALLSGISGQHLSAFRYFSFTVFFVNLFAILTWTSFFELLPRHAFFSRLTYVVPGVFACWIALATPVKVDMGFIKYALESALGRQSLASAYKDRHALSGPLVRATKSIPAGSRVYCFNALQCLVGPECELENFVSYALGKHWHDVMFESPERAREVLQQQHLDYFLIDLKAEVWDIIQYSPLFSADNIGSFLQVAWNERDLYLLTWPGSGTHPIPESFLARYRDNLPKSA